MKNSRVQKLFSSPVFIFIYYLVIFVLFTEAFRSPPHHWQGALYWGSISSAFLTLITMKRIKKMNAESSQKQVLSLNEAVRTATLPTDPNVLKELPAELDKCELSTVKSKKQVIPMFGGFFILCLLFAIADKDLSFAVLAAILLGLGTFFYYQMNKTLGNIRSLREQLKQPKSHLASR